MADIATLGIAVDTKQLEAATKALDKHGTTAQKTEAEVKKAGDGMSNGMKSVVAVNDNVDASFQKVYGSASVVEKLLRGMFAGALIAGVAGLATAITGLYGDMVKLEDASKRTGVSIENMQKLRYGAAAGGVGNADFFSGVNKLGAEANSNFREGEGKLKELFEANNMSITDRAGKLKDVNTLLQEGAVLVQNAKTEFDKIDIAKILGLSEDWIKALENGPVWLAAAGAEALKAGGIIDAELVRRAADFDEKWKASSEQFAIRMKAAIADVGSALMNLINQMDQSDLGQKLNKLAIRDKLQRGGQLSDQEVGILKGMNTIQPGSAADFAIREFDRRKLSQFKLSEAQNQNSGVDISVRPQKLTGGTSIPNKKSGGGGGAEDVDEFKKLIEATDIRIKQLETEKNALGMTEEAARLYRAEQELLVAAEKKGIELSPEQITQLKEKAVQMANLRGEIEKINKEQADADQMAKNLGSSFKSFFTDLRSGLEKGKGWWKSFSDAATKAMDKFFSKMLDGLMNDTFQQLFGKGSGNGNIFSGFLSMFGVGNSGSSVTQLFANGGFVSGPGSGKSDSIPALLSNGEFVINAAATKKFAPLLHAINSGSAARFASGGPVGRVSPGIAANSNVNVVVNNNHSGAAIRTERGRDENGMEALMIMVDERVEGNLTSGRYDRSMGNRFGSSTRKVQR